MPVPRAQVRANLVQLLQYQLAREREYGPLLLAVWVNIRDEAEDAFLLEVFERFVSPEGGGHDVMRFPAMGAMWLPGTYIVEAYSRAAFEEALDGGRPELLAVREALASGTAEILWPEPAAASGLADALRGA